METEWDSKVPFALCIPSPISCTGLWLGHLPSGIIEMDKEPIIPKFGEHLIVVAVHIS